MVGGFDLVGQSLKLLPFPFQLTPASWFVKSNAEPQYRIMPPWSEEELVEVAKLCHPTLSESDNYERYAIVGGSARNILDESHATAGFLRNPASGCTPKDLLGLLQRPSVHLLAYRKVVSDIGSLIHIQVADPYTIDKAEYVFASETAASAVLQELSQYCKQELSTTVYQFLRGDMAKGLCGPLLECKLHRDLVARGATVRVTDLHNGKSMLVKIPVANGGVARRYRLLSDVDPQVRAYFQPAKLTEGAIDTILPPGVCLHLTISRKHPIIFDSMLKAANHLLVSAEIQRRCQSSIDDRCPRLFEQKPFGVTAVEASDKQKRDEEQV